MDIAHLLNPLSPVPLESEQSPSPRTRPHNVNASNGRESSSAANEFESRSDASCVEPVSHNHQTRRNSSASTSSSAGPQSCAEYVTDVHVGPVRFGPHKPTEAAEREQRRFYIDPPVAEIVKKPVTIPYYSEKTPFCKQTGRDGFEVFQYDFKYKHNPNVDEDTASHEHGDVFTMMWDYNIGLVRVTHLFKCLGHGKTTPARAIRATPGLRDICFSITGGTILAQGYWMPWPCAKAVAAMFCYKIRYALVPVFGNDFPDMCLVPDDPAYQRWTIDSELVKASANAMAAKVGALTLKLPKVGPTLEQSTTEAAKNNKRPIPEDTNVTEYSESKRKRLTPNVNSPAPRVDKATARGDWADAPSQSSIADTRRTHLQRSCVRKMDYNVDKSSVTSSDAFESPAPENQAGVSEMNATRHAGQKFDVSPAAFTQVSTVTSPAMPRASLRLTRSPAEQPARARPTALERPRSRLLARIAPALPLDDPDKAYTEDFGTRTNEANCAPASKGHKRAFSQVEHSDNNVQDADCERGVEPASSVSSSSRGGGSTGERDTPGSQNNRPKKKQATIQSMIHDCREHRFSPFDASNPVTTSYHLPPMYTREEIEAAEALMALAREAANLI